MMNQPNHISVMTQPALEGLAIQPGGWYVDATLGAGGYTRALLGKQAKVIAFDHDQQAIANAEQQFSREISQGQLVLVRENFSKLKQTIEQLRHDHPITEIRGVVYDFGTSTDQLQSAERGFSFIGDGNLDMRMDDRLGVTAKDLLAVLSVNQLADVFREYGGEESALAIAKAIDFHRQRRGPITTTHQLVKIIEKTKFRQRSHLHPATKVFQALRVLVNDELTNIAESLPQALNSMQQGRIVTVAFHEGEDRIVKQLFKSWEAAGKGQILTKKAVKPTPEEIASNVRARSARLRIFSV